MGYTAALLFSSILLVPVVAVIAAPVFLAARRFGFVPRGGHGILAYLLIMCSGYGLIYLGFTVDQVILRPARLQARYLGETVAGPLSLVGFEMGGFQDPYSIWRYQLSEGQVVSLRPRCRWYDEPGGRRICTLFADHDERWVASVNLEGNELRIDDGLW